MESGIRIIDAFNARGRKKAEEKLPNLLQDIKDIVDSQSHTDSIFENLKKVHDENEGKDNVVRISIDTKDKVKIGEFSRSVYNRIDVKAGDHDFCSEHITPFGIIDLTKDRLELIFTQGKITADFMVDVIESYWLKSGYQNSKDTLIINADNGPEKNSHRTQYIKRIIEFSAKYNVKVILAYYPPYHSKYNPIERVWGKGVLYVTGKLFSKQVSEI